MILRIYLFCLYATFFISSGLFLMILANIDPFVSPFWLIAIFYITIILLLMSLFSLVGFYLKLWFSNREVIFALLTPTLRQAFFLALGFVGILFLQQLRVLNWWVGALFLTAILFIELFFRREKNIRKG